MEQPPMSKDVPSRNLRHYYGIAERALLGLAMSLIIFVVERQMHRRVHRRPSA
jgi:hypothetical protein